MSRIQKACFVFITLLSATFFSCGKDSCFSYSDKDSTMKVGCTDDNDSSQTSQTSSQSDSNDSSQTSSCTSSAKYNMYIEDITSYYISYYSLYQTSGVVITYATNNNAGIKEGDVITQINDTKIENTDDVRAAFSYLASCDNMTLTLWRGKKSFQVTIPYYWSKGFSKLQIGGQKD